MGRPPTVRTEEAAEDPVRADAKTTIAATAAANGAERPLASRCLQVVPRRLAPLPSMTTPSFSEPDPAGPPRGRHERAGDGAREKLDGAPYSRCGRAGKTFSRPWLWGDVDLCPRRCGSLRRHDGHLQTRERPRIRQPLLLLGSDQEDQCGRGRCAGTFRVEPDPAGVPR